MGGVVVVYTDQEIFEVRLVNSAHIGNMLLGADTLFIRLEHNRSSMSIVSRKVVTFVPAHTLEANPDIGLGIFQDMAKMQCSIGIGKGIGYQNLTF